MLTVNEIVDLTGQKRGTVEQYRNELQKHKIIGNNESLDNRAFEVFKKVILYKESEQITWVNSMQRAIQEEYGEEMDLPFHWTKEIILKNLIRAIEKDTIEVTGDMLDEKNEDDFFIIFHLIIDNFKELSKTYDTYSGSFGTDGNPITTFKLCGKDYIYYIVGKYNHLTRSEDIHLFYNEGAEFNIMRCKHICGGSANKGRLAELWKLCSHIRYKERKNGDTSL